MFSSTSGFHTPIRLYYVLIFTFAIAILLLFYESNSSRTINPYHDPYELQSVECHICVEESVIDVTTANTNVSFSGELVNSTKATVEIDALTSSEANSWIVTSPLSFYSDPFGATSDPSKRAYATTLYGENYLAGALLLGYSLRKHGMLHPNLAQHMLLLHIPGRLELITSASPDDRLGNHGSRQNPHTGRLDHFDQIFYIDADALVVKKFPEIWSFPAPFAACRDIRVGTDTIWLPTINAGTFLPKPNRHLLPYMLEGALEMDYDHWFAEQGLLNEYWLLDLTLYPYIFNGQLDLKRGFPEIRSVFKHEMRIIHYTGTKPWDCEHHADLPDECCIWLDNWEELVEVGSHQNLSFPHNFLNLSKTGYCGNPDFTG